MRTPELIVKVNIAKSIDYSQSTLSTETKPTRPAILKTGSRKPKSKSGKKKPSKKYNSSMEKKIKESLKTNPGEEVESSEDENSNLIDDESDDVGEVDDDEIELEDPLNYEDLAENEQEEGLVDDDVDDELNGGDSDDENELEEEDDENLSVYSGQSDKSNSEKLMRSVGNDEQNSSSSNQPESDKVVADLDNRTSSDSKDIG
jgi:RNA polymerase primary sigma factor